jgi:hypothetical protein
LHEYNASIGDRTKLKPTNCPYCQNFKLCDHTNLEALHPELISEWHPDNLKPMKEYACASRKKVLWICSKNINCKCHVWNASIDKRTCIKKPCGCPFCRGLKVCEHLNLKTVHPELIEEWHPDNNDMSTYAPNSNKKVKWKCSKNPEHIWLSTISHRTSINNPRGCPHCTTNGYSKSQIKWLTEIEKAEKIYIQHACKPEGEHSIPTIGKVDGYCKDTNTVYELHGDFWHGNPLRFKKDDINPIVKKTYGELYQKTIARDQAIRDLGYTLITKWETTET